MQIMPSTYVNCKPTNQPTNKYTRTQIQHTKIYFIKYQVILFSQNLLRIQFYTKYMHSYITTLIDIRSFLHQSTMTKGNFTKKMCQNLEYFFRNGNPIIISNFALPHKHKHWIYIVAAKKSTVSQQRILQQST